MVLMLDRSAQGSGQGFALARDCGAPHADPTPARTLRRLGFLPSLSTPRFEGPRAPRPSRQRDEVAGDWRPV